MKTLSYLLGGLLLLTGCSQRPQVAPNEFLIEGYIENLPDSSIIQLFKPDGDLLKFKALDTVINGRFTLRDTLSTTTKYALLGRGSEFPNTWVELWAAPGSYTRVEGRGTNFKTWTYDSEVAEQQQENALLDASRTEWEKLGSDLVKVNRWFDYMDSHPGNDSIRQLARAKVDSIRQLTEESHTQVLIKEMEVLSQMPVSSWWMDKLKSQMRILEYAPEHPVVPILLKAAERLSEADRQTPLGKVIMSYVNLPQEVKIGDEMVDGDLYDREGRLHHLAELKGKYILLDFWSSGCGPCVASIPEVEEIAQLYADRLAVVGISEDGESSWKDFLRQKNMKGLQWNQLGRSTPTLQQTYRINGIPSFVLISPEGKVVDKWMGYGQNSLKARLQKHFPAK